MDGIHDLGGRQGFGPVIRDDDVFHAPWERRAFGLAMTARVRGNTDDFRHAIERLDPVTYLTAGYYGRWLAALEVRLVDRGLVTSDEVDAAAGPAGVAARPSAVRTGPLPPGDDGQGPCRPAAPPPRFCPGQRVRVRELHPRGHTRLPGYVRGRSGVVAVVQPGFVFPDTNAHGLGEEPQHVYAVAFAAQDLWGEGDHTVHVDLFEAYLEPAGAQP